MLKKITHQITQLNRRFEACYILACMFCYITCLSMFPWLRRGQALAGVKGLIIIVQMGHVTSGHMAARIFQSCVLSCYS